MRKEPSENQGFIIIVVAPHEERALPGEPEALGNINT